MDFDPSTSPIMLVAGLVAAAGAAVAVAWGRLKRVRVPRKGVWATPVSVWFRVGVSPDAALEAINHWGKLGFDVSLGNSQFHNVELKVDRALDLRTSPEQPYRAGSTFTESVEVRGQTTIQRATIRVLPDATALTIAHELGHALGLDHPINPPSGHIMHFDAARVGWDSRGCKA